MPALCSQQLSVILTDGSGRSHPVSTADYDSSDSLIYPPGDAPPEVDYPNPGVVLNSVRIPLSAFDGPVTLTDVVAINFGFAQQSSGALLVSDIAVSSTIDRVPSDIVMVIDRSGSMVAQDFEAGNTETHLETAVTAARFFAASLDPDQGHRIAVVSYNNLAEQRLGFIAVDADFDPNSTDRQSPWGQFSGALDTLIADGPWGTTSIGAGVEQALSMLPDFAATGRRPAILLLTDGRQNTAPCLAIEREGEYETGECDAGNIDANLLKETDPRLSDTAICSVGMGRADGQVDEKILEKFSTRYLDAKSNAADYNAVKAAFSKCAAEFGPDGIAIDPSGVLARADVAAPAFTYDSCGDRKLSFVSGWHRTVPEVGEMRLLVTDPNGELLRPVAPAGGSRSLDWDIQRVTAPQSGSWRFQLIRRHTRITNGFSSDAFVDHHQGVSLIRRELHRLCPDGCGQVLYFEDGRADSSDPSVYEDALTAEGLYGTGLVQDALSFDASDAGQFADALAAGDYDLLVYVHQLGDDGSVEEEYDLELYTALCTTTVPAIITDTRGPSEAPKAESFVRRIHECSGAVASSHHTNYDRLVDAQGSGTLLDGAHALINRGYSTFSYSIGAIDFDELAIATGDYAYLEVGATQLEGGTDQTFLEEPDGLIETTFGSIVTFSADQPFYYYVPAPTPRYAEQWSAEVRFEGMAPIIPRVQLKPDEQQLTVSLLTEGRLPASAAGSMNAWAEVIRPTEDLSSVAAAFGCTGETSPNGDLVFGTQSVAPEDIPVTREIHALNDDGQSGDVTSGDGVLSASVPADVQGTYALTHFLEFEYSDASGASCSVHREARVTRYVGDEISGSGAACTPSNPNGGFGPAGIVLGDDPSSCPGGTNIIVGTSGNDCLMGTWGSDCILGLGGRDHICGGGGADFISGGSGNDQIYGGWGEDVIFGGSGSDDLKGSCGNDTIHGGPGNDHIEGDSGDDRLHGDDGDDLLDGGRGQDVILGGSGNDDISGRDEDDTIHGGPGDDQCDGGDGANQCILCETQVNCGGTLGPECTSDADCVDGVCVAGRCEALPPGCDAANAIDLGAPGNNVTVANNACLRANDQYPVWWGSSRQMKLETTTGGTYPVPFDWANECSNGSGSGLFTGDWQAQFLPGIDSSCATVIDLQGDGSGPVTLRYWAE